MTTAAHIEVRNLTMAHGDFVVQHDLNFSVNKGKFLSSWAVTAAVNQP